MPAGVGLLEPPGIGMPELPRLVKIFILLVVPIGTVALP